jgi:hypothetical protein
MKAQLPVLENVRIASPCQVSWDEMQGDERQRFCSHCRLNVYNLSAMSRNEAEAFVQQREGRTCVRFFQRADGTVITGDCPLGLRAVKQRLMRMLAGVATILAGLVFGGLAGRVLAASGPGEEHPRVVQLLEWLGLREPEPMPLMGDIICPVPANNPPASNLPGSY